MVECREVEAVEGTKEVGSEDTGEVEAKGLGGPVAGKDDVMRGAELVSREVGMPRGISSREEALNSSRARSLLVGRVGGGVKLLGLPVRERRAGEMRGAGAEEEAVAEVTDAPRWSTVKARGTSMVYYCT